MKPAMREQAAATVTELFVADPRVAIILAEISTPYFEDAFSLDSARAVNVGIMEQTMVGVAAGLAMEGFHPVVHTITPFLVERPLEQLKLDFGYQGLGGTFVSAGSSYDYGTSGATHHSPGDAQVLSSIPGMQILIPGTPSEIDLLIRQTYANGHPTYVRTSIGRNGGGFDVEAGRTNVVRRGANGTVIAFGPMLDRTLEAVAGLDVSVLYATTVAPFDAETLAQVAGQHPAVITVEPFYEGSVAASIAEALSHVPSRIGSVGIRRTFIDHYGTVDEHDLALGLDAASIREKISRFLDGD
jgi:transketolase